MGELANSQRKKLAWIAITAIIVILGRLLLATADLPNQELLKELLYVLGGIVVSVAGGSALVDAWVRRHGTK